MMMNDSFYSRWMQDERKANLKQENHKVKLGKKYVKMIILEMKRDPRIT